MDSGSGLLPGPGSFYNCPFRQEWPVGRSLATLLSPACQLQHSVLAIVLLKKSSSSYSDRRSFRSQFQFLTVAQQRLFSFVPIC